MPRRNRNAGRFYVGDDKRMFETAEAAASLAMTFAKDAADGSSFYVHEVGVHGRVISVSKVGKDTIVRRVR